MVERGWKWELGNGTRNHFWQDFWCDDKAFTEIQGAIHQNVSVQQVLGGNDPIAFRSDL
jgi:hypothetical protein